MSQLVKTRGIIIRTAPFSETSRLVHWVTEDHGKLMTLAKGALRPRNPLLGQLDLFYTCELIYYAQDRDTVSITRESSILKDRRSFRTNWRAAAAAAYAAQLTAGVMPPHDPSPELFTMLDSFLDELEERGWNEPTLFLHELRLLEQQGFHPRLHQCAGCGRDLGTGVTCGFSTRRGGLVCEHCTAGEHARMVGADIVAILRHWIGSSGWNVTRAARCRETQIAMLRELIGEFLTYHLDLKPQPRTNTLKLLKEHISAVAKTATRADKSAC